MYAAKLLFKRALRAAVLTAGGAFIASAAYAASAQDLDFSSQEGVGFYSDMFNDNVYYEAVDYLHFGNLYRKLTGKKTRAQDINVYDEVPDSAFFTNRHGRGRLSAEALGRGALTQAPDFSGTLNVIYAESNDLHPLLFARDARGVLYQLKFDAQDNRELSTGADVVGSRFYHALGYNVPGSGIVLLDPEKINAAEGSLYYASTGFKRPLTGEALQEMLLFIPYDEDGKIRASATQVLEGEIAGPFGLRGRDRKEPGDEIAHEQRRAIRALRVFSSWLNHYDVRSGHTLRSIVETQGRREVKNYLLDYSSALGSGTYDAKPPMAAYEHLFDYGETAKAFFSLGFWEKPWQAKWREAGEETGPPAVGYFDSLAFKPQAFKTQLPQRAFKNLTRADGFWAAKLILTFTDDDLKALVGAGGYSDPQDVQRIVQALAERRDALGRYWFSQANPLDAFDLSAGKLVFSDLAVEHGFETAEGARYQAEVRAPGQKSLQTVLESREASFPVDSAWFQAQPELELTIRTFRKSSPDAGPSVKVRISREGVLGITHQD